MIERVVLVVGSGDGEKALEWVIGRSLSHPVQVRLVGASDMASCDFKAEKMLMQEAADRIFYNSSQTAVDMSPTTGPVPEGLLDAASEADLLVMSAERRHSIASTLANSLQSAAVDSSCATVIVPDDWSPSAPCPVRVGVFDDRSCDRAALFAARETQDTGVELEVVHAWAGQISAADTSDRFVDPAEDRAEHRRVLADALERIGAAYHWVRLRGLLDQRLAVAALAEDVVRGQTLVLGSHRPGPLAGLLPGAVARGVLWHATGPVCIVPPGRQKGLPPRQEGFPVLAAAYCVRGMDPPSIREEPCRC